MAIVKGPASYVGSKPIASSKSGGTVYKTPVGRQVQPVKPQAAYNQYYGAPAPVSPPSGGGGGGGGGSVQQSNIGPAPMEPYPDQPDLDFDALIAPAIEGLEAAIGPLQQEFDAYKTAQEGQRVRDIDSTKQQVAEQEGILGRKKTEQTAKGESAIDEARRMYSEIGQGIQARYGGTTGTGAFANELAGSQTLRNIGNVREQVSQALADADDKLLQVKEIGRIALQEIEDKTRDRIAAAKSNLDQQLADIRRQKGELQSRKAELAMNAMNIYRQTVAEVNARNTAYKQQLYNSQLAAENQLKASLARGKQAAEGFSIRQLTSGNISTPVMVGQKTGTIQGLGGSPVPGYDQSNYQLYDIGNYNRLKEQEQTNSDDNELIQYN